MFDGVGALDVRVADETLVWLTLVADVTETDVAETEVPVAVGLGAAPEASP